HPSPNDRLSKFSSDKQTFYKLLSELEIAFANIQLGNGLGNALKTIDTALELETYKNNVDLLKAKAICIHKIWLNTVNVDDKRARSLLDMPSFKDSMLVNKEGTKGLFNGIPGEEDIYNLAKDAYKEVFDKSVPDPAFVSNYASLIVYEKKERDRAVVLSEFAARAGGIQTINNLAVVYLIAEKKEEALNLIMSLLINISTGLKIQALGFKSEYSDNEYIKQMEEKASIRKSFDPYYIPETTTVLLNSVLIARANKKKEDAKKLGEYYLSDFDSESKWAAYIKEELGLKTKFQPLSIEVSIEGIKMGDDKSIVSKKWKDPEVTTAFTIKDELDNEKNLDCEAMYYKKKNSRVIVCSGKVREIYFLHESNLKTNNNLKTGMNIEAVEKILGKKYQNQGGFRKYTLSNRSVFYLRFQDNILTEIYLVR
ncbi:MAG: hypothetical protein KDK45_09370, partial [Leptospiraceae bacterium]|nr:hypothetical protein [Leptospiraceae bacterium]